MEHLQGKVAVITGGAGGIGRALAEELLAEGAKVVVADVQAGLVEACVAELADRGDIVGVPTDVTDPASVAALADRTYAEHGACHLLFNNAGVGAPSALTWETTINDWRWVHNVNVMGVVHGVLEFVPRMIAGGEPGHVVNTSSGNGGIAPMATASVYAASKAAVTTLTECLAAQLVSEGTQLRASVFYPSGGLLRTGLWEAEKTRPAALAREVPRRSEAMTVEKLEAMAERGGFDLPWQDRNELARFALDGVKADRFAIMIGVESIGETLRDRAAHYERGELPPPTESGLG
jgi:NAD(P)-dependent dehydrogenase (short-subunit alcohol dehydrogenase family)